jgi:hypothetical protein
VIADQKSDSCLEFALCHQSIQQKVNTESKGISISGTMTDPSHS